MTLCLRAKSLVSSFNGWQHWTWQASYFWSASSPRDNCHKCGCMCEITRRKSLKSEHCSLICDAQMIRMIRRCSQTHPDALDRFSRWFLNSVSHRGGIGEPLLWPLTAAGPSQPWGPIKAILVLMTGPPECECLVRQETSDKGRAYITYINSIYIKV